MEQLEVVIDSKSTAAFAFQSFAFASQDRSMHSCCLEKFAETFVGQ